MGSPLVVRETGPGYDAAAVDAAASRFEDVAGRLELLAEDLPDRDEGQALAASGHLDADTLERWARDLRRIEGTVATIKASVLRLADTAKVANQAGLASTGQWIKDRFQTSSREASRQQHLADTLERLPRARAAVASGELGPEQAAVLGQAARRGRIGDPTEVEDTLLDAARRSSPEKLRERVRRAEQAADGDALRQDENRQHALRRASCVKQDDGMWRLDGLLPGLEGELFATALHAFTTPDPAETPRHLRRRPEQRTADGLAALARAAVDFELAPQSGGLKPHLMVLIPYDGPDPWDPSKLDQARRRAQQPSTAETVGGTALSHEAAQRLLCDARITRVVLSGRPEPLDVGRTKRSWPVAQRAALVVRDRGCRGPGCDRPASWCDAHHVVWWTRKGRTSVRNGVLLCHQHHRLVHEGGWRLTVDADGVATFLDPRGRRYVTRPPDPGKQGQRPSNPAETGPDGPHASAPTRSMALPAADTAADAPDPPAASLGREPPGAPRLPFANGPPPG